MHIIGYLAFASAMCLLLLIGRVLLTGSQNYNWMIWNLFLGWIPVIASTYVVRSSKRFTSILWSGIWFIFLPNAFYMLTDFIYLRSAHGKIFWYDLVFFFSFASTGILIGVLSLYQMQELVTKMKGVNAGRIFAFVTLCLNGVGVYIGRFLRWNSWDVVTDPLSLMVSLSERFVRTDAIFFSGLFALLFNTVYFLFISLSLSHKQIEHKEK